MTSIRPNNEGDGPRGLIFDIVRFAIHDGPGVRTTVFLKGCPLHCSWCHNPESVSARPELSYSERDCIGCGLCLKTCRHGVHRLENGRHVVERSLCAVCGACVRVCPVQALDLCGREMSVSEVLTEVLKDRPFYASSGGGLTVSGGEPLAQPEFLACLLRCAKREGLHTCLDTSGYADWSILDGLRPLVDLFLYDLKAVDDELHRKFTGVSNRRILDNLFLLHESGATIRLRVPLVPGLTATPTCLRECERLAASLHHLQGVDKLPYHGFGNPKRKRFGYSERSPIVGAESTQATVAECGAAAPSVNAANGEQDP